MDNTIKKIDVETLEQINGGEGNEWGVTCPKCGSRNVSFKYEHDEIGVFDCCHCGHHFSQGY